MLRRSDNFDISRRNTFRMNVSCACFIEYDGPQDLEELDFKNLPQPVIHMGGGSNLLFTGDFRGTILHSNIRYSRIVARAEDDVLVEVGAGVVLDDFCAWASDNELWGAENLSGIPGEVGAAAVQNVGAYGVEIKDIISQVRCYDLELRKEVTFSPVQCGYGYRDSVFKKAPVKGRYAVLSVLFHLNKACSPNLEYGNLRAALSGKEIFSVSEVREVILNVRNSKLPSPDEVGSAGSFFKNPIVDKATYSEVESIAKSEHGDNYRVPHFEQKDGSVKIPAAWMIDQCGLKGYEMGNAAVYEKQPLVIINKTGKATPQEIIQLENKIMEEVHAKYGIVLFPEVEHI